MNQAAPASVRSPQEFSSGFIQTIHWFFFGLFLATFALVWTATVFSLSLGGELDLGIGGLLFLTAVTTLIALSRRLPAQNVLLAAVIAAVIGSGAHWLGAVIGIPFGPFDYTANAGPRMFDVLPWGVPFLWIVMTLNSRGVARLILRPWRKMRAYGFWSIGLTALLTLLLDFGLEPFASRFRHYWFWHPTKFPLDWYGAPVSNFMGWLVAALLIMAFATPSLIKKKPTKSQPDYHPLIVWVLLNLLFAGAAFSQHFWPAAVLGCAACLVVIISSIRGATW